MSRVLVGVHYPDDVLAGALLGTAAAVLVCLLAARVPWPLTGLRRGPREPRARDGETLQKRCSVSDRRRGRGSVTSTAMS